MRRLSVGMVVRLLVTLGVCVLFGNVAVGETLDLEMNQDPTALGWSVR